MEEKESVRQREGEIHLEYHDYTNLELFSVVFRHLVGGGKAGF